MDKTLNGIIQFNRDQLYDKAYDRFLAMGGQKDKLEEEYRPEMKGIYSDHHVFDFKENTLKLEGQAICCEGFLDIDKEEVESIYVYAISIKEEDISGSGSEELFKDIFKTALLDSGREMFKEEIGKNQILDFAPGLNKMDIKEMQNLGKVLDVSKVGIEINPLGFMEPVKSFIGIIIKLNEGKKPLKSMDGCENCIGNTMNCDFCNMKNEFKYGVAIDIGTTTLEGALVRLNDSYTLGNKKVSNPQIKYGKDLISRINVASLKEENLANMSKLVNSSINEIINDLCEEAKISSEEIGEVVLCGNTVMSHMFLEKSVKGLSMAPFALAYEGEIKIKGKESLLNINRDANVWMVPNISGHVGGDMMSGIICSKLYEKQGLTILIDIGTNGEIALSLDGNITVCSTAAGPAFEGASIKYGMAARGGAIDGIEIYKNGEVRLRTIDGEEALGICGSGLIDIVAKLIEHGVIDNTGKLLNSEEIYNKELAKRVRSNDGVREFRLYKEIALTQKDIRELQMGKAAIRAGIIALLSRANKNEEDIEKILIAGNFGNSMNINSALVIGLIPKVKDIEFIGNSAQKGAEMLLISEDLKRKAVKLAEITDHLELADSTVFNEEFIKSMSFS